MYVQLQDGEIVAYSLPRTGLLSDGRAVSGYHFLHPDILHAEGWREVQDEGPPEYDEETHYYTRELEVQGDEVVAVYTIHENPVGQTETDALIDELEQLDSTADPYYRAWLQSQVEATIEAEEDPEEKARLQARYVGIEEE